MAAKFNLLIAAKTSGSAAIKRMGNSMQGLQGKLKNVGLSLRGVNKGFAALGIALGGGAFAGMVKNAVDTGDSFGKLSTQTGIASNTLMAYVNAGKLAGVEQETIDKGLRRLAQSMREADQGVATYKDAFDDLGLSVRNTDGTLKSSEQVLGEISDRFADLPDGATKAAIAMEILGRSGASLIPFLNMGAEGIKQFNYELSGDFARNAEDFNDTMTRIGFSFQGANLQLVDNLLPTLNTFALLIEDFLKDQPKLEELFDAVDAGFKIIASSAFATIAAVRFLFRSIKDLAEITGEISQGNFKKAMEIMKKGFTDTWKQAEEDINTLRIIINGDPNSLKEGIDSVTESGKGAETQLSLTFGQQMQAKLKTFKDGIKSIQESMADVVIKGIKGMEDALVNFVMTGKLSFRDLANSIIKDMIRIQIQQSITGPLSSFIGGLFKGPTVPTNTPAIAGAKARGGPVRGGSSYLVGERGPEIFTPKTSGNITPNHQLGGNTSVVVNVDASGTDVQGNDQQANQLGRLISIAVQSELIKQRRPGGLLTA